MCRHEPYTWFWLALVAAAYLLVLLFAEVPTSRQVLPFPQYELQARWISRVLSGRAQLPATAEMEVSCFA